LVPSARLFALDGLVPGSAQNFIAADVAPVLSGLDEIADWSAHARQAGRRLPAALHVDSGLNRLGLSADDVSILASERERLEHLDVRLVMSHLACADDPDHPHNARQRAAFEQRRATLALPSASASLAASDGLMLGAPFHYGGQAFQGGATPVNPVVTVAAGILQVRTVDAGESVGYSASWVAPRQTRVAIVAAGYADGLGRGLSASSNETGGIVMVHGQSAPIVGRVSMDLITVDVTDVVGRVQRGDLVTLIGPGLTIEAMGRAAGTIGYEVLTRLGTRFARRYVGGGA
jgi:alanine racemase